MYVILWRYNASSPWYLHNKPLGSEQDVRAEINSMVRYDVAGRREYRWQTIGDVSTWHDPFAEQAAREEPKPCDLHTTFSPACGHCLEVNGYRDPTDVPEEWFK